MYYVARSCLCKAGLAGDDIVLVYCLPIHHWQTQACQGLHGEYRPERCVYIYVGIDVKAYSKLRMYIYYKDPHILQLALYIYIWCGILTMQLIG